MSRYLLILVVFVFGCAEDRPISSKGDPERGAMVFETCASCHALVHDANEPYFGPHLVGLFGRPVAADPNYDYSQAIESLGGEWTETRLAEYLKAPTVYAPGTTMVQALPDPQDVADVMAYMRQVIDASDGSAD